MRISDIEFPEGVLASLRAHELVVFAGNGVSRGDPARLPSFSDLAAELAKGTPLRREKDEEEDHFLGRLADHGTDVHTLAANILDRNGPEPTELHRDLLRLYPTSDKVRIVTTNFDLLFQKAAAREFAEPIESFSAPALPLGRDFSGIVHVHGSLRRPRDMVLTDRDFGRGYLTEGWARRFLSELFRTATVLIIGYGHDDTIVKYLARALPERGAGKRYVLTSENNRAKWASLGIEPISFPKASRDDYSAQSRGVQKLAAIVRRSILDWQREVADLAAKKPPLDEDACATLEYALKNADTTRFFTNVATDDDWVEWLNERGYLAPMFAADNVVLSECDFLIANWLGDKFCVNGSLALIRLISETKVSPSAHLWFVLCRQVGKSGKTVSPELTRRWVSLLLACTPARRDPLPLTWLAEKSLEIGEHSLALTVFDQLTSLRLSLAPGILPDPTDPSSFETFDVVVTPIGDTYQLDKLGGALRSCMEKLATDMLCIAMAKLSHAHTLLCSWGKASRDWDTSSFSRAAIEPSSHDRIVDPLDPLIDLARDCLEYLMTRESDDRRYLCDRLARADAPLLRRLSVFGIQTRTDLNSDEKLDWIVDTNSMQDVNLHHELFALVKSAYPAASKASRSGLIKSICSQPEVSDNTEDTRTNDYEQYNWLNWILQTDPSCEIAQAAFAAVVGKHPDFAPRDHPDLTHWIGEFHSPEPFLSADELIAKGPDHWLPILLAETEGETRWSRARMIQSVTEAAKQRPRWGLDFARTLADGGRWESDLWDGLIPAWGSAGLDEDERQQALELMSKRELYRAHAGTMTDALHGLVRISEKNLSRESLANANEIARALWPFALEEQFEGVDRDWLSSAINSPAGQLAQFWLQSLAAWRHCQEFAATAMNAEYRTIFDSMVATPGAAGLMARSVICAQLSFMLSADPVWTKEHLIGRFASDRQGHDFDAAWDGFLTWGRITPAVAECMDSLFRGAVRRMEQAPDHRRRRFVEYYAIMVAYFGDDPIQGLIPDFFAHASGASREQFAYHVENLLRRMTEPQQEEAWTRWLEGYWTNRLVGIPVPLDDKEIHVMMRWLLRLPAVLPAAVAVATKMKSVEIEDPLMIYELGQGGLEGEDLASRYPSEVARLLVHLSRCAIPAYAWQDARSLIDRLLAAELPTALALELREVKARFGL